MPKYIFVTGGVMSGLGKGVTTASLAKLLSLAGLRVTCAKIDPYLNTDAGTMNPLIHGEVFVTDDGGETDMDIGTYERFLDHCLSKEHNITTGQIYKEVIEAERRGDYLGECVQIIPHVTDAIKNRIKSLAEGKPLDVLIVECGGTVGDIESLPFLEAFRQMRLESGSEDTLFVHITLAPIIEAVGEQKTKPTQHSVQELRRIGIQPDVIVVRSSKPLSLEAKRKISLFTNVELEAVISNYDAPSVYSVPEVLYQEGIVDIVAKKLGMGPLKVRWDGWKEVADSFLKAEREVRIALVGKYSSLADSYVSINHALMHASAYLGAKAFIKWLDAEDFERNPELLSLLDRFDGILVPGGFGKRGSEGKIQAASYALDRGLPYLGICFGFQLAVVAFARHRCGLEGAASTELAPDTPHPVIDLLPEQKGIRDMGATMRLGGHDIELVEGSLAHRIYGCTKIRERHRHRYELNPSYRDVLEARGMRFTGFSDGGRRAEVLEVPEHPFYLATQYHGEFISRPGRPEPSYLHFVKAALERHHSIKG